jgi:hypothetical protein
MRLALEKTKISERNRYWYLVWAKQYVDFLKDRPVATSAEADVLRFLKGKSRPGRERWQLAQAIDAIVFLLRQVFDRSDVSGARLKQKLPEVLRSVVRSAEDGQAAGSEVAMSLPAKKRRRRWGDYDRAGAIFAAFG